MSRSTVVLAIMLSFGPFLLLMGMEKEQKVTTFKYSNPYFDPELQKSLTLIMLKNRNAVEVAALDKDTLHIIAKNSYDCHCDELLKSDIGKRLEKKLRKLNDESRIAKYEGAEIKFNDFDLITMNDEGRDIFFHFIRALSHKYTFGLSEYFYGCRVDLKDESKRKYLGVLSVDDYNKMLHLPVKLRNRVGGLCSVKTIGLETPYSSYIKKNVIKVIKRAINQIKVDIENRDKDGLEVIFAFSTIGVGGGVGAWVTEGEPYLSSFGCYVGLGVACGFTGLTATIIALMAQDMHNELKIYGPEFELIYKPILTLEEQENIKKAEKEAQGKKEQRDKALHKPIKMKQSEILTQNLSKGVQLNRLSLKNKE